MKLTKAEADLIGVEPDTEKELVELVKSTYWVIDDAPWPWYERQRQMKVLERLAAKLGFTIGIEDYL